MPTWAIMVAGSLGLIFGVSLQRFVNRDDWLSFFVAVLALFGALALTLRHTH